MIRILDFVIDADARQFIVGKIRKVKKDDGTFKEDIANASYVSTLSEAYKVVYRAKVKELVHDRDMDVKEAYEAIRAIESHIQELVNQLSAGA